MLHDILILGEPSSGKSNFLKMLAFKWSLKGSIIRQKKTPSIRLSNDLLDGFIIDRTQEDYQSGLWELVYNSNEISISLPEFNGEEFTSLTQNMNWSQEWSSRIKETSGIFLMIPCDKGIVYDLANPIPHAQETKKRSRKKSQNTEINIMSIAELDFNYIKFTQQVLALKEIARKGEVRLPLVIILNFWDKIYDVNLNQSPEEVLEKILPWFYTYLKNNWDKDYFEIYGMSPLGDLAEKLFVRNKFPSNAKDEEINARMNFKRDLPKQSWLVTNQNPNEKIFDLNVPFEWLFSKIGY
ncbi:TPA: hypothetical protein JI173_00055 [Acinetobacter baumannii]|nr:hypothetical protein [Acinetobacter baumannii]